VRDVDRRGYTEAFKEQVLAAYQERASMRGIARVFGISRNTLTRWLREKGGASRT
jgi:transposase-like protein